MPDDVYQAAREHISEIELVNLTMAVIAINAWNRTAAAWRRRQAGRCGTTSVTLTRVAG